MAEEKARAELSHIHTHRNLIGFDENGVSIVTHEAAHLDGADEEERQRAFVKDYNEAVKAYRKTFPTKQDQIDATPDPAVRDMLLRSEQLGFDTAFDRFDAQQPQCNFGLSGTCCRICNMGPCRVTAKAPRGVCGADADLIVARNMLRSAAAGVAQHGMHAREVILSLKWAAEGKLDLPILGEQKIRSVAAAFGIRTERRQLKNIAADLADALLDDLSRSDPHEPYRTIGAMAPPERRKVWEELDILPVSAYHEVFDAQHRSGCATDGQASAEIVPDATRQTLIALSDESQALRYAWVVHTDNYLPDFDAGYLAHYVSADGEYLYAIPVSEPGDDESLAGEAAAFPFDKLEKSTWSGTVTKHDGTTVEVSVPTLVDPDTGDVFLADGERKILCTDFADYTYNDTISPRVQTDGRFADNEILIYDSFIKVWDCYKETGWTGPDGDGTPSLLKMDMADKDGNVIRNACYTGRNAGFQTFAFNREDADGECVDIIGHEFTHCVTSALMTSTIYMNDSGAINEGMSDILGNLIEMEVAYDQDGAWLIGENEGIPLRSMKDPHDRHQPEFTWDAYYGPAVAEGSDANDNGGTHVNSSLLNLISYKLSQAGMPNEDQIYYWMNVALAMTPSTDYPQLAELLPWCMQQSGYAEYVDAVKQAVGEAQLTVSEPPKAPKEGTGYVKLNLPESEAFERSKLRLNLTPAGGDIENDSFMAWVGADTDVLTATVLPGDYAMSVVYWKGESVADFYVLSDDGWVMADDAANADFKVFTVASEEVVELPSNGLFE